MSRTEELRELISEYNGREHELEERFKPGSYGYHEAVDRASLLVSTCEQFLLDHPAVIMDEVVYNEVSRVLSKLLGLYQLLALRHAE